MYVEAPTSTVRPYMVCAILRGVKFNALRYKSFIDLQEKLHQNICRRRMYVSMGTHDLDTVKGPFRYKALPPEDIQLVPLTENNGRSFNGKELLNFYREDASAKHLKPYTDLIYNSPVYPVVVDGNDTVMSLPPVINSKHSRIQMHTTNVLIEATNTDLVKANIVLDTMIAMFSEYCTDPFTCEPVDVVYEKGAGGPSVTHVGDEPTILTTPLLSRRTCDAKISEIHGIVGVPLEVDDIIAYCDRMQLGPAEHIAEQGLIRVQVPPTRSDILHAVDVIEDVAIAYGYNNIPQSVPHTLTVGAPLAINQMTDLLRAEIARAGYVEMLTHGLCSTAENFTHLRRPVGPAASLSNPANIEYEVVRTTLLPGALKTLAHNNSVSHKDGIKLFEISDTVERDEVTAIGAHNVRQLCAVYSSFGAGLEVIHGLVDRIMNCVQIRATDSYVSNSLTEGEAKDRRKIAKEGFAYYVRHTDAEPCFFKGMGAEIILQTLDKEGLCTGEKTIGVFGVVHPEVLHNFNVEYPCSVVEMNVDILM